MWELNSFQVPNNSLASNVTNFTEEVHVLLVDHDRDSLLCIANMLQLCSYKVTMVEFASTALKMLGNGQKFDIVIANIHSPDYQGFKLLEKAVHMNIMTIYLHEKFMAAVAQLGEGRCYPKDILEIMNVPGLTRMQVASHLQKCRNDNWRVPERKNKGNGGEGSSSTKKDHVRRFGTMPKSFMNYQQEKNQEKSSEKNPIPAAETANGRRSGDQGSSSSSSKNQQISIGPNQELVILSGIPNIGNRIPSDDDHAQLLSQGGQNLSVIGFQHQGPPVGIDNSGPNPNPNPNPPRRQISDDFFEFPDMDYISENISALQQEESASATATATANNNAAQTRHAYGGFNQANYNDQEVPMIMEGGGGGGGLEYGSGGEANGGN
ncbi:hypothetical protein M9H77_29022 [Catharanthus roseus]|uniref:Uncharacterized protein n=1 Tax=Catharanthus roseus TaxID=4058 RepID=A0ACC0AHY7_CATRO|nr:hypothetical protein M9H77_29022 [Catharanthus roseus]